VTITVVIPALNEERMLPVTLARVAGLGFDEIIIVDGGSTDRTPEIVRSFTPPIPALGVTLLTAPAGRARQMNVGASGSRSDVFLFLHADTFLPHDARAAIERALGDRACVGGRFDVRFEPTGVLSGVIGRLMNWRSRWTGIATGDQALFVRRSAFEQLSGFTDIPIMEDIDFARRLKRIGRVAALRSQVITSYRRWDASGPLRTVVLMWILRFLYWVGISPHKISHLYGAIR
jgi:rSAM/selenodomain-associated transferase 2